MVSSDSHGGFSCPVGLQDTASESGKLSVTWLSHSMAPAFQRVHLASGLITLLTRSYNPAEVVNTSVLGCSDFARRYSRNLV